MTYDPHETRADLITKSNDLVGHPNAGYVQGLLVIATGLFAIAAELRALAQKRHQTDG